MKPPSAELAGVAQLLGDAVVGTTSVVESMHAAIARRVALGLDTGIARLVYASVRTVARGASTAVGRLLGALPPLPAPGPRREAWRSALNGVWGDHLELTGNPLALDMTLRRDGADLDLAASGLGRQLPDATPKLLVLAHGLCMNDRQWLRDGHDHGAALGRELGYTSVYVRYNTGRAIADNGRDLAGLLERLLGAWPVPPTRLTLLGHSMGGLVLRSACADAERNALSWRARLDDLVFLGTPHQGAPLERAGRALEQALGSTPFSAPLTSISAARSAGITDLRHGRIDRAGAGAAEPDRSLPQGVRCFALAGIRGTDPASTAQRAIGDGLVPVSSALAQGGRGRASLRFPAQRTRIVRETDHFALLSRQDVYAQLRDWLRGA